MGAYEVLVVEDEPAIADSVCGALQREGWHAVHARSAEEAWTTLRSRSFDLVILDLVLPGMSGFELLSLLRPQDPHIGVLMMTARTSVEDCVASLRHGADDYLSKPFSMLELLARSHALLRRSGKGAHVSTLSGLSIDRMARSAHANGVRLDLAVREFDLLALLLAHAPRTVPRATIVREVWDGRARATPLDNVIEVHVARLRRKLAEAGAPGLIHTVRGLGFCVAPEPP